MRIYLDYAALTPLDPKVQEEMRKTETAFWHNPSSLYREGEESREKLEYARKKIAEILNCRNGEVYLTSGGTESLNISISGIILEAEKRLGKTGKVPHVIASTIEHPGVLEVLRNFMRLQKIELSLVNPNGAGIVNPSSIQKEIKDSTVLVCLMHANNEIGTIQPVGKVGSVIKEYRKQKELNKDEPLLPYPYFLVDASQSALYENVSIERLGADILILDGIKIYGPRGAGILIVKHGVGMSPILFGGGQEKGMRPGTQNIPGAAGLALALEIATEKRETESLRLAEIRDFAIEKILREIPGSSLNGDQEHRLPNNINICFPGTDSEFLVIKLDTLGFAVSSASACLNLKDENSSYVLEALGNPNCAGSSLRFTLGRETTEEHLKLLIEKLKEIISCS